MASLLGWFVSSRVFLSLKDCYTILISWYHWALFFLLQLMDLLALRKSLQIKFSPGMVLPSMILFGLQLWKYPLCWGNHLEMLSHGWSNYAIQSPFLFRCFTPCYVVFTWLNHDLRWISFIKLACERESIKLTCERESWLCSLKTPLSLFARKRSIPCLIVLIGSQLLMVVEPTKTLYNEAGIKWWQFSIDLIFILAENGHFHYLLISVVSLTVALW